MQIKLYRRSSIILGTVLLVNIAALLWLVFNKSAWEANRYPVIIGFVLFAILCVMIFAYFDLNSDRNLIRKAVKNGDVAMAKIKSGTFVKFARDARMKNHVYWKLDAILYDDDMNPHDITIIEKFSTHQTKIPVGHVYVTYDPKHLDDCLIIPNVIISSIPEYQFLAETYEKEIKPIYLNAYYKEGLVLQSYKESMKEQSEYYKEYNKQVKEKLDANKKN